MQRRASWWIGGVVVLLILLSTAAYARMWVEGGIWKANHPNDCAEEGLICADWDLQGSSATNCCIDPSGINSSDPDACVSRMRHPH